MAVSNILGVGTTSFRAAAERSILHLAATPANRVLADSHPSSDEVTSLHVNNALVESLGTRAGVGNGTGMIPTRNASKNSKGGQEP